jgi:hypothetical protein
VTHKHDGNINLPSTVRTNVAPVTMSYDKENREIGNKVGGTIVSYAYSGDSLKRSEIGGEWNHDLGLGWQ